MAKTLSQHSRGVSGMTLISRITGLGRDVLMAGWLGNNWLQDCFSFAFTTPNLFRNLLGEGALASSFIPVFSEKLALPDRSPAQQLFQKVFSGLGLILGLLTAGVLILLAGLWLQYEDQEQRRWMFWLTAVMFPYVIAVCLVALCSAVLNCLERFALPAFMPVLLNLFQMAAMLLAPRLRFWLAETRGQVTLVAFSVLAAGALQLGWSVRSLRRHGFACRWQLDFRDSDVRRIIRMTGPMILGLGILQFGSLLDNVIIMALTGLAGQESFSVFGMTFTYPLGEGTMSAVNQAHRLYQFPLGVLGMAVATVAFPTFSRLSAAGNYRALSQSVTSALRISLVESIPSGIGLLILAHPIVRVIFEHGRYTEADTAATAHILRYYSLGMWAYCAHHIILRGFYSLKDTLTPLRVMAKTLTLGVVLDIVLIWVPGLRAAALGLSTSIVSSLNVIILGTMLGRRIGGLETKSLLETIGKTLAASALMAAVLWAAQHYGHPANRYLALGLYLLIGLFVYITACRVLGVAEVRELLSRRRR